MKFSSIAVLSVLLVASLPSSANAKPKGKKDKGKKDNDGDVSQVRTASDNKGAKKGAKKGTKPSLDDDVEVIVHYRNDKGREDLKLEANEGKVDKDIKRFKAATLKTKRSKINKIAKDPNIQSVSISNTYYALPHTRGAKSQREEYEHRKLAETSPYGIGMVEADQLAQGPNLVTVCVVDTGYGEGHPDLPTINEHGVDGFSSYGSSELWNVDGNSHGTHCAGTIGAIGNNGIGVTSVNPDPTKFSFFIGKGLTNSGSGSSSGVMDAVASCVNNGAKVISMSLGCNNCYGQTEADMYKDLYDEGVLIIAAAGNSGNSVPSYPASYPTVMSVGAVDSNRNIASFSQYNDQVEISAPGVGVESTVTTGGGSGFGYASYDGTSMATPHVAGVAALVWSHFPNCSNNQIRNVLLKTALDRGDSGCDINYGHGIVRAKAAYDLLSAEGCEAGGIDPTGDLSTVAIGGCDQDPDYQPPPTMAPTPFQCDEVTVTIELTTDNFGGETSWELIDASGAVQASGSVYSSNTNYQINKCVSADTCTFAIEDAYGDGICCGFGSGSYSVIRDGVRFDRDGIFESSETFTICDGSTPPPGTPPTSQPTPAPVTPAPVTLAPVTPAPVTPAPVTPAPVTPAPVTPAPATTAPVTTAPVPTPTLPPVVSPSSPPGCDGVGVKLTLRTDNYPGETRWTIANWLTNVEVEQGGPYSLQNSLSTQEMCLPDDACYVFTVSDSYGDGICCGFGQGSYSLEVNGATLVSNGGEFGSAAYSLFGNCQSSAGASAQNTDSKKKTKPKE